ncbi:MAG: hypothetical protein AB1757_21690 [Acidobacteriota bacterium]
MNQPENQEGMNRTIEVEELPIEELVKLVVKGGNGSVQKLGSRRLLLQGDGTHS